MFEMFRRVLDQNNETMKNLPKTSFQKPYRPMGLEKRRVSSTTIKLIKFESK